MEAARCIEKEDWLANQHFLDDGVPTSTSEQQEDVEKLVDNKFAMYRARIKNLAPEDKGPVLERFKHLAYLNKGLCYLSESYEVLDASRPWLCYWIVHSLELLGEKFTPNSPRALPSSLANVNVQMEVLQCSTSDVAFADIG
ncbi:protein farnesyltransferase subunit beta [Strongylocentrotus purpuratus]|uniref:Prenyltransferase alpha-alpha toroid domain-containing protein n=1 Tax=Strongylocentrotus purpuratus TaxID=7668 RepID=A0A7M7PP59_STRPU|nr:protein farnesyltransferase subunit beta [Strongylocentrotus purpuratus]